MSILDNDEFLHTSAELLEKVEEYYRISKLKKPVWCKITPHVMKYIAQQAVTHVLLGAINNTNKVMDKDDTSTQKVIINSNIGSTVNEEFVNLALTSETTNVVLINKLEAFWKEAPECLKEHMQTQIITCICERTKSILDNQYQKLKGSDTSLIPDHLKSCNFLFDEDNNYHYQCNIDENNNNNNQPKNLSDNSQIHVNNNDNDDTFRLDPIDIEINNNTSRTQNIMKHLDIMIEALGSQL